MPLPSEYGPKALSCLYSHSQPDPDWKVKTELAIVDVFDRSSIQATI